MDIGANIKRYRELRGLSVEQLGDKMGIGKAGIYKWEKNETTPSIESLTDVAKALDCRLMDLLADNITQGQNEATVKEKALGDDSINMIRSLLELEKVGNYMFMPKSVLEGDYRLSLKSERDQTIDALNRLIANLEGEVADKDKEIKDLRLMIASLSATPQKTK